MNFMQDSNERISETEAKLLVSKYDKDFDGLITCAEVLTDLIMI